MNFFQRNFMFEMNVPGWLRLAAVPLAILTIVVQHWTALSSLDWGHFFTQLFGG